MKPRTCEHCGNPATCVGRYEGHGPIEFACDECCGHGCEDGWCIQLEDATVDDVLDKLIETGTAVAELEDSVSVAPSSDLARFADMAAEEARLLAQAGDPLCEREGCGHPGTEHGADGCEHVVQGQPSDCCPRPGFVAPGAAPRPTCATCTHWYSPGADVGECMGAEGSAIAYAMDSCDGHEAVAPGEVKP